MTISPSSVPMRWPGGPLEIARRSKIQGFTPQARETLEQWHRPEALAMLDGSPVDVLVISWAAGLPEDAAQQQSAVPLVEAAHKRNLQVVGWVAAAAAGRVRPVFPPRP